MRMVSAIVGYFFFGTQASLCLSFLACRSYGRSQNIFFRSDFLYFTSVFCADGRSPVALPPALLARCQPFQGVLRGTAQLSER